MTVRLIAVVVLVFGSCFSSAPAAEPTRIAVVSSSSSSAADAVIDLVTVALSQQETVVLLERLAVTDALAEQELSLTGSQGADSAIQVGKLLATDLFAVVEIEAGTTRPTGQRSVQKQLPPQPVGLVVFDAVTGTRLWDQALPKSDVEELAKLVSTGVMSAVSKARSDSVDRKAVCLVTVRNAELPRNFDSHRAAMAALLQRHLTRQPALELLERRHLEHFNRERTLAAAAAGRKLAASAVLIEVDLVRAEGADGVRAVAALTASTGQRLGTAAASVDAPDVLLLTERLAESLVRELGQPFASSIADPRLEARRFQMESNSAVIHERFEDAIPASEAAIALLPDDADIAVELANTLGRASRNLLFTKSFSPIKGATLEPVTEADVIQSIGWISRSLAIRRQFYAAAHSSGDDERIAADWKRFEGTRWAFVVQTAVDQVMRQIRTAERTQSRSPVVDVAFGELGSEWVDWLEQIVADGAPVVAVRDRPHAMLSIDSPDAYVDRQVRWLAAWHRHMRENLDEDTMSMRLCTYVAREVGAAWAQPTPEGFERLRKTYETIQSDDSHVMFAFLGLQGRAAVSKRSGQPIKEGILDEVHEVRRRLLEHAARPVVSKRDTFLKRHRNYLVYEGFFESIQWPWTGETPAQRIEAGLVGVRTMLDRRVVTNNMLSLLRLMQSSGEEYWPDLYRLIEELNEHHRKKEFVAETYWELLATNTGKMQAQILKRFPELDPTRLPSEWASQRQLVSIKDIPGVDYVVIPMFSEDSMLCLGVTRVTTPGRIRLIEVPLTGEAHPRVLNETNFTSEFITYRSQGLRSIRGVCRTDDTVFVATGENGVVRLPIDGSKPSWINADLGLLSNYTHAVSILDGRLYVANGDLGTDGFVLGKEMYLQSFNLEDTEDHDVIVSTRRKKRESPFDDGPLFDVESMTSDPRRNRLLMTITMQRRPGSSGQDAKTGLWEYSREKGFRQVTPFRGHFYRGFADTFPDAPLTNRLVLTDREGVMAMNLTSDKPDWAYRQISWSVDLSHRNRIRTEIRYKGPFALTNDSLWTFEPLGRLNIRTGKHNRFAVPTEPGPLASHRIVAPASLLLRVLPQRNQLLYADGTSIWLLGIPKASAD